MKKLLYKVNNILFSTLLHYI